MKKIYNALMLGCTYAILTISVFYLFAAISGGTSPVLPPQRFFLLTGFGIAVSLINLGASGVKINTVAREALRYLAVLLSFVITVLLSKSEGTNAATVISLSALFTLLYLIVFLIALLVRRGAKAATKGARKKADTPSTSTSKSYKPLYSDNNDK